MKRAVARTDSETSVSTTRRGLSSARRTVTGENGCRRSACCGAWCAGVDPPRRRDAPLVRQPAVQRASRRSDSSSSIRSCSPTRSTLATARSLDSTIRCSSASSASRCRLIASGSPARTPESRRRSAAASSSVPSFPTSPSTSLPAQQRLLLGDRQVGVDLRALLLGDLARRARVGEVVRLDLHPVAFNGLVGCVLLREHDLLGHRGKVDLVGLLVQVVLLGEVLGLK